MARKHKAKRQVIFSERFFDGIDLLIALTNARVKLASDDCSMSEVGTRGTVSIVVNDTNYELKIETDR